MRKCSFAFPGTYGHECGSPSVIVAVFKADNTSDGLYHAGRCSVCIRHKGGENADMLRTESENGQVNQWK